MFMSETYRHPTVEDCRFNVEATKPGSEMSIEHITQKYKSGTLNSKVAEHQSGYPGDQFIPSENHGMPSFCSVSPGYLADNVEYNLHHGDDPNCDNSLEADACFNIVYRDVKEAIVSFGCTAETTVEIFRLKHRDLSPETQTCQLRKANFSLAQVKRLCEPHKSIETKKQRKVVLVDSAKVQRKWKRNIKYQSDQNTNNSRDGYRYLEHSVPRHTTGHVNLESAPGSVKEKDDFSNSFFWRIKNKATLMRSDSHTLDEKSENESVMGVVSQENSSAASINLCSVPGDIWYGLRLRDGEPVVMTSRNRSGKRRDRGKGANEKSFYNYNNRKYRKQKSNFRRKKRVSREEQLAPEVDSGCDESFNRRTSVAPRQPVSYADLVQDENNVAKNADMIAEKRQRKHHVQNLLARSRFVH